MLCVTCQQLLLQEDLANKIRKLSMRIMSEAATGGALLKKGVLRNFAKFTGKHLC